MFFFLNFQEQLDSMRRLCLAEGIEDWKVQQTIGNDYLQHRLSLR